MAFRTEIKDGVAELVIDNPPVNALDTQGWAAFAAEIATVGARDDVRCLLLTGAGRAFCAGQDLHDRLASAGDQPPDLGASLEQNYNPLIRALTTMPRPVIAAVNGVAAGAGANIALACDIVLAARSASFVQAFCRLGLVPDAGGSWPAPAEPTPPPAARRYPTILPPGARRPSERPARPAA